MPLQDLQYTGTFRLNFFRSFGSGVTEVTMFEVTPCLLVADFVTC
jgi:hypothetical protein